MIPAKPQTKALVFPAPKPEKGRVVTMTVKRFSWKRTFVFALCFAAGLAAGTLVMKIF